MQQVGANQTLRQLHTYASELPAEITHNDDSLGTNINSAGRTETNGTTTPGLSAHQPYSIDSTPEENDSAVAPVAQTEPPPSVLRTYASGGQASEPRAGIAHTQRSANTPTTSIAALVKRFVTKTLSWTFAVPCTEITPTCTSATARRRQYASSLRAEATEATLRTTHDAGYFECVTQTIEPN